MSHGVVESRNPARPDEVVWRGVEELEQVPRAVEAARRAFGPWRDRTMESRADFLRRWAEVTRANAGRIAALITREMGKTLAESAQEAALLSDKVTTTLEEFVLARVRGYELPAGATRVNACAFRAYGAMAVIGPFNFPAHLPNGHWVPALLAGNTILFKPSEKTPGVGALMGELMQQAGVPEGVFGVVQGGAAVASALVANPEVDGVLFTGSWPVGRRILEANLDRPGRMVALEMGGSNAAVILPDADLRQAVIESVRCAFLTTGQRCTCTRRIIVHKAIAERFIPAFLRCASTLVVGAPDAREPIFMGPIVSQQARDATLEFQRQRAGEGARVLMEATALKGAGWFVTPGVLEVSRFERATDREVFGPVVQIALTDSLEDAIQQTNASDYGLAASIFTRDADASAQFMRAVRCGCININCGTAGASGKLPFGGLGRSGNLRPAGAYMIDACAAPVASMIERGDACTIPAGMLAPESV